MMRLQLSFIIFLIMLKLAPMYVLAQSIEYEMLNPYEGKSPYGIYFENKNKIVAPKLTEVESKNLTERSVSYKLRKNADLKVTNRRNYYEGYNSCSENYSIEERRYNETTSYTFNFKILSSASNISNNIFDSELDNPRREGPSGNTEGNTEGHVGAPIGEIKCLWITMILLYCGYIFLRRKGSI